ncbi:hypothetical protein OG216_34935 [Streptomycetaceae bacterium NBC_01309]
MSVTARNSRRPRQWIRGKAAALTAGATAAVLAVGAVTLLDTDGGGPARPASAGPAPVDESEAQRQARQFGQPVRVETSLTATSTTTANPDGTFTWTQHALPIRARVDGAWRDIDTELRRVAGGWAPKATTTKIVFSAGGTAAASGAHGKPRHLPVEDPTPPPPPTASVEPPSLPDAMPSLPETQESAQVPVATPAPTASAPQSPSAPAPSGTSSGQATAELATEAALPPGALLRMTSPEGQSFTLMWPNGTLPQAEVAGDQALYPEVFPGVDLLLTARDGGFSQVLVVKTREAAANPQLADVAYRLSSAELTFTHDAESGVTRAVDASGQMVAASPTPFMWDSAGHAPGSHWAEQQAAAAPGSPAPSTAAASTSSPDAAPAAAASVAPTSPTASSSAKTGTLALPGLGGPEPGTHEAVVAARLDGDRLRLTPDRGMLSSPETVFPVFVDPSFWSKQAGWTLAYKKYSTSSFWMGANFNGGTTTARIGYESDSGGTARSFFRMSFDPNLLAGAALKSSTFRILETHSWSCQARAVDLHHTGAISEGTTWANMPAPGVLQQSVNTAKGYSASCPGDYLAFNTLNAATMARDNRWGDVTFVLKAANENDTYAWKKFAVNPSMEIVYNRPPWQSGAISTTPGGPCRTDANNVIADNDVTIHAHNADPDGDLRDVFLRVWDETTGARIYDGWAPLQGDGWFHYLIPHTSLKNGSTYAYTMDPHDWSDAWAGATGYPGAINNPCRFKVDKSAPNAPSVSSAQYPAGSDAAWPTGGEYGTPGVFTFGANGTADTVEYAYSFDKNNFQQRVKAPAPGKAATINATPAHAGPAQLYVKAIDKVGNWSWQTVYSFFVEPRDQVDGPMDFTGDQKPDLTLVTAGGDLQVFPSFSGGKLNKAINGTRTDDGTGNTGQNQVPAGYFKDALTTYHGDWWGADGFQDLIARMPDGKLWVYPGNGRGAVDTAARIELLLPAGSPAPSAITQILALGDATGDGLPDMLAVVGQELWAFNGYTGATVLSAAKIGTGGWADYTIHTAGDISGDGAYDLLMREKGDNGELFLRKGTKQGNGTDLASLGGGTKTVYGASGWQQSYYPLLQAIPDVTGDGIPDLWATTTTGVRHLWSGGRTAFDNRTDLGGDGMDFCQAFPGATGGTKTLCGPVLAKYLDLGGPSGAYKPVTDTLTAPDGAGKYTYFRTAGATEDNAVIYWHTNTGAALVQGTLLKKWASLNWEKGLLGYPTADEYADGTAGWYSLFQKGGIYAERGKAAYYVLNDIHLKYIERGHTATLGYPVNDETGAPDGIGWFNHFSKGGVSVYWSPNTGAHSIGGAIRTRWAELGWETVLGYPTLDDTKTPDGVGYFNHFTNYASIYWHPSTDAWAVFGSIRTYWASIGWETSWLGYPTSNEFDIPGGRRSNFQNGYITWTAATGAINAYRN